MIKHHLKVEDRVDVQLHYTQNIIGEKHSKILSRIMFSPLPCNLHTSIQKHTLPVYSGYPYHQKMRKLRFRGLLVKIIHYLVVSWPNVFYFMDIAQY